MSRSLVWEAIPVLSSQFADGGRTTSWPELGAYTRYPEEEPERFAQTGNTGQDSHDKRHSRTEAVDEVHGQSSSRLVAGAGRWQSRYPTASPGG